MMISITTMMMIIMIFVLMIYYHQYETMMKMGDRVSHEEVVVDSQSSRPCPHNHRVIILT
jgi:hypothetical protein